MRVRKKPRTAQELLQAILEDWLVDDIVGTFEIRLVFCLIAVLGLQEANVRAQKRATTAHALH